MESLFPDREFCELKNSFTWIGEKCISYENRLFSNQNKFFMPHWRRVINISISSCFASLIIIYAALILGIIGVYYKQPTCLIVDSVLFMLASVFYVFGMAIHFDNCLERRPEMASSCSLNYLRKSLTYWTGWSQYLGLGGVALCTATAGAVYGLSRVVITLINTVPEFKKRVPV